MDANFSLNTRNTPRIITALPLSSSFSLKTEKPLKLPEIILTQKSHKNPQKSLSLSRIFTWNHSLSRIFEETVEGSSEEGRKEKEKSPELTEFTPKSQKPKPQGNFFFLPNEMRFWVVFWHFWVFLCCHEVHLVVMGIFLVFFIMGSMSSI